MRETVNFAFGESQCFTRKFWSWKFIKPRCNGGRRSTFAGNSALLHSDVIDFAMLPAQRFWRETVSLLDVTNESARCWENIPSYRAIIHRSGGG